MIGKSRPLHKLVYAGVLSALVFASALLASSQSAYAAEEEGWKCGFCVYSSYTQKHHFMGTCWPSSGQNCMDCKAFNACHTDPQVGTCDEYHWECGRSQASIERLEDALAVPGAPESLHALIDASDSGVEVTADGYAIVLGCDDETVVHAVRVPTEIASQLRGADVRAAVVVD